MIQAAAHPGATIAQATSLYAFLLRAQVRFIPVLSRPRTVGGILALDQLCGALHALDLPLLSLDQRHEASNPACPVQAGAAAAGHGPRDPADSDLRRDPLRYAIRRPARAYLTETAREVPDADLVLVHAAARDLEHLLRRAPSGPGGARRILLCECALPLAEAAQHDARHLLADASTLALHGVRLARRAALACARLAIRWLRRPAMRLRASDRTRLFWDPAGTTDDVDPAARSSAAVAAGATRPEHPPHPAADSAVPHAPNADEMMFTPPDSYGAPHVYR